MFVSNILIPILCAVGLSAILITGAQAYRLMDGVGYLRSVKPLSRASVPLWKRVLGKKVSATQYWCGVCLKAHSSRSEAVDCSRADLLGENTVRPSSMTIRGPITTVNWSPPKTSKSSSKTHPETTSSASTGSTTTTTLSEREETNMTPQDSTGWRARKTLRRRRGG